MKSIEEIKNIAKKSIKTPTIGRKYPKKNFAEVIGYDKPVFKFIGNTIYFYLKIDDVERRNEIPKIEYGEKYKDLLKINNISKKNAITFEND